MNILNQYKEWHKATNQKNGYPSCIKKFVPYCEKNNIKYNEITFDQLNKFFLELREMGLIDNGTLNNYNKALRNFYKFLIRCNLVEGEIENGKVINSPSYKVLKQIKTLKETRKDRTYFTEQELKDILEMSIDLYQLEPTKTKAIVWTMFFTGVRPAEFRNLKRIDIDLKNGEAIIKERDRFSPKTYVERRVPLINEVINYIQKYFSTEPEKENAFNCTYSQFSTLFKKLTEFSPSNKRLTPRTLRNSCAYFLLRVEDENNRPLFTVKEVQKILGHKRIETTLIYYDPTNKEACNAVKDRLNKIRKRKYK